MTVSSDMDTMAALGDTIVDKYLGGHADANLATLLTANTGLYVNEKPVIQLLIGLVGELLNEIFDINALATAYEARIVALEPP